MRGLLADNHLEGYMPHLRSLFETLEVWDLIKPLDVELVTFPELEIDKTLDDRALWQFCQAERYVLLTDNRNDDGPDSLEATLRDSWRSGSLPVITLRKLSRFRRDRDYAKRVAGDIAEILFGIAFEQRYCDQPRLWVPDFLAAPFPGRSS